MAFKFIPDPLQVIYAIYHRSDPAVMADYAAFGCGELVKFAGISRALEQHPARALEPCAPRALENRALELAPAPVIGRALEPGVGRALELKVPARRKPSNRAKFSPVDVEDLRALERNGCSITKIAAELGVHRSTISRMLAAVTYSRGY